MCSRAEEFHFEISGEGPPELNYFEHRLSYTLFINKKLLVNRRTWVSHCSGAFSKFWRSSCEKIAPKHSPLSFSKLVAMLIMIMVSTKEWYESWSSLQLAEYILILTVNTLCSYTNQSWSRNTFHQKGNTRQSKNPGDRSATNGTHRKCVFGVLGKNAGGRTFLKTNPSSKRYVLRC